MTIMQEGKVGQAKWRRYGGIHVGHVLLGKVP